MPPAALAAALGAAADALDEAAGDLVPIADNETALGSPRLTGEVARTTVQLRMFRDLVVTGSYLDAVITTELAPGAPARDLRRICVPIGPVAVFGASNFPFAFSVTGGDTASVLAAGCPVVFKAHPAHPATSEAVGSLPTSALETAGPPDGAFALVRGGAGVGSSLVLAPEVAAVGFTGSTDLGRQLFYLAATRPVPVPVFAEMRSLNPVVPAPSAVTDDVVDGIACLLAGSVANGWGQSFTKPGLIVVPEEAAPALTASLIDALASTGPAHLLTRSIQHAFERGVAKAAGIPGVRAWSSVSRSEGFSCAAKLLVTDAVTFQWGAATARGALRPSSGRSDRDRRGTAGRHAHSSRRQPHRHGARPRGRALGMPGSGAAGSTGGSHRARWCSHRRGRGCLHASRADPIPPARLRGRPRSALPPYAVGSDPSPTRTRLRPCFRRDSRTPTPGRSSGPWMGATLPPGQGNNPPAARVSASVASDA